MADTLTGVIDRVTFHNLDNGYCVLRVVARGHRDPVVVVGHLAHAVAGEFLEAAGDWVSDRQFGEQFKATELKCSPPHTPEGIARYLGSGLVKGIGPTYAKKIVAAFGAGTLDVIDKSPASLAQVKGIGPKRLQQIRDGWKESQGVRAVMVFLQSFGVGTARAVRIYKEYGEAAIETVRANPYRLSEDIWGVGFRTADELAIRLGTAKDSPLRAQAAVRHVLREAATTRGHVGLPEEIVVEETGALTQIPPAAVGEAIEALRHADELVRDAVGTSETLLYLKNYYLAETGVARGLRALLCPLLPRFGGEGLGVRGKSQDEETEQRLSPDAPSPPTPLPRSGGEGSQISHLEAKMGIAFAPAQRDAVLAAMTHRVLVLTGGPGTGKTTIVRAILGAFADSGKQVALCAPTGRAAKRLAESTGREARTIHRLLEFDASVGGFRRGEHNPIDADLVVVDETSMVDVSLMNHLLRAIPPTAGLLLVGDSDQLPSVGAGSVLADLIASGAIPVARLTQVHRQAESSFIVRAAHAVNAGEEPESAPPGQGDFFFVDAADPPTILDRLRTMVRERIPAAFGLDPIRDVQVLSPMNKSELGVQNLNRELQTLLNPPASGTAEVQRFGTTFRAGDKVIQTRNNYQRDTFNGDIGRVAEIDAVDQVLTATFDGRPVEYDFAELDELQLAYACSIHKSQGSEYPAVVIPVHTQHFVMLQRNLLYTSITRGRKLVVLVGSRKALWIAVNKSETTKRFSLLAERLKAPAPAPLSPASGERGWG